MLSFLVIKLYVVRGSLSGCRVKSRKGFSALRMFAAVPWLFFWIPEKNDLIEKKNAYAN